MALSNGRQSGLDGVVGSELIAKMGMGVVTDSKS